MANYTIPAPEINTRDGVNTSSWPSNGDLLPYASFMNLTANEGEQVFTMFAPAGHNITINKIEYLAYNFNKLLI